MSTDSLELSRVQGAVPLFPLAPQRNHDQETPESYDEKQCVDVQQGVNPLDADRSDGGSVNPALIVDNCTAGAHEGISSVCTFGGDSVGNGDRAGGCAVSKPLKRNEHVDKMGDLELECGERQAPAFGDAIGDPRDSRRREKIR